MVSISLVVCHFYYSVYASEYHCQLEVEKETSNEIDGIRIGTYNIKSLDYNKNNLKKFHDDIADLNLDIICLQEVDKNSLRSGNIDMVQEMAQASGYEYYHFYSSMWIVSGYYGLGILSRYPIVEVSSWLLPNSLLKEPRILTKTTLLVDGKYIDIFNTHLTYENNDIRVLQMDYIKENVDFSNYTILTGDFNSFGMNGNFELETINHVNENQKYKTFRDFASPDDIYYADSLTVVDQGVKMSSFSDHNILYVQLQWDKS